MTDLAQVSTMLVYGAMAAYTVALLAFVVDFTGLRDGGPDRPRKAAGIAMSTTWLGVGLHLAGTITRGVASGRVPWANMYEFTLVSTLVAVGIFLALAFPHRPGQRGQQGTRRDMRFLGAFVVGPALLLLGVGVAVLYVRADGVMPALDSYWLIIHVSVATIAMGVVTVSATLSALQLVQERQERKSLEAEATAVVHSGDREMVPAGGPATPAAGGGQAPPRGMSRLIKALPSSAEFERLAFRLNAVGFMLWTFTIIAGAIWAEHAWGRPWGWDPKETWSLIVWVIYAAYLHARATRGWEGRRAAMLSILGFLAAIGNYFLVNLLFNSLHSYSGIG